MSITIPAAVTALAGSQGAALAEGFALLPGSIELDDYLGEERLVVALSQRPLAEETVRAATRAAFEADKTNKRGNRRWRQVSADAGRRRWWKRRSPWRTFAYLALHGICGVKAAWVQQWQ